MKNQDKFEDTEENKLEYTNIYTEYVFILEEVIEANLKQQYSDEQIETFYSTFKENMPEYSKVNPEVVETLFGFIDFEKFKKAILLSKNMSDQNFKKNERTEMVIEQSSYDQNYKAFQGYLSEDPSSNGWRQAVAQKPAHGFEAKVW